MYSYLSLLLFILFVCSSATPFSLIGPQRSILSEVSNNDKSDHSDYAIDLNSTNFDDVLKDTPATYAVVEFFAHWCPASRNYKPHYEKVARLFNGPDAVHAGIILMTRVDCALKINNKLCDKFSVGHYPMLFWGHPSKFVGGSWEPKQEKSDLRVIDDARTADLLLSWINEKFGSSFGLDDSKFENEYLSSNISDPGQAIYDVEEATFTAFDIILEHKMIKPETRASLIKFLQLLVAHHPSRRCRKGSAELLVSFDDLYPIDFWSNNQQEADKGSVRNLKICGKDVPRGYWTFCRSSKNDTRGFSCGLWVLLHSLSVRIEDGESQFAFNATCGFVQNFFICEEWRQHFYKMCSSVSSTFNKASDYALWLWSAHNKVNERLSKEETSLGTGDPNFPKTIWPRKQLCPSCYLGHDHRNNKTEGNQDGVKKFLTTFNKAHDYALSLLSANNKVNDKEETSLGTDHRNNKTERNQDGVKKFLPTFNKAHDYALSLWSANNKVDDKEETSLGTDHRNNKTERNQDGVKKFLPTFNKAHDYALSLWSAHNKVNDKEETSLGTDHRNNKIEWNQDEVYKFLTTYYGKTITSMYKDEIVGNNGTDGAVEDLIVEASNAVVVPLGAALAIAVASCAFGALACYWRSKLTSNWVMKKIN